MMANSSPPNMSPGLDAVLRIVDTIGRLAGYLAAVALMALFLLMLSEVVARNLLGVSNPIAWDYSAYMMGAIFFLAAATALKHDVHVRVTLLSETVSARAAKNLDVIATLLAFAIACYLSFSLGDQAFQSLMRGAKSFSVVATPLWIPQSVLFIGAVIFALQLLARVVRVAMGAEPSAVAGERN